MGPCIFIAAPTTLVFQKLAFLDRVLGSVRVPVSAALPRFSLVVCLSPGVWASPTEGNPGLQLRGLLPGRRQCKPLCASWQRIIKWICLHTHFSWWWGWCLWHSQSKCQPFNFLCYSFFLIYSLLLIYPEGLLMNFAVRLLTFVHQTTARPGPYICVAHHRHLSTSLNH